MKHIERVILCLALSSFYFNALKSQNTIPVAGGSATGSGGSVSFTSGQLVWNMYTGSTGSLLQGVQQPYEISMITAVANTEYINLECSVYPNPTVGLIKLIIGSSENHNLRYRLYDANGVLLQDKKVEAEETEISMEKLSSAIYFLKVIENNMETKVFKIIKR